jgi:hypothetical protein
VTVALDPTIGGIRDGQLQIVDDTFTSPQVVNLSGTGTLPLTDSANALIFNAQKLGTLSAPKNITLTNHESEAETFTLTPTANFTVTTNCGGAANGGYAIAADSSCVLSVVFAPGATATAGPLTGTLSVSDSAPGGLPLTVSLTGSGTVNNPAAAVSVVAPGAAAAGATLDVVITGNGYTHFGASSVVSFFQTNNPAKACAITTKVLGSPAPTANTLNAQLQIGANPVFGACNIQVTTPLSGGGKEVAALGSAFVIASPNNAFTITSINPSFGAQGQTENVEFTAAGMTFVAGTTFANFGDGVTVNTLVPADSNPNDGNFLANITISNTTFVGGRTITVVTGGDFATSSPGAFQIVSNGATLLSVSPTLTPVTPASEAQGWSGQIYLTASGTHFLQGATEVSIGGGVNVGNVQVINQTTAVAQVAVTANATIGVQSVTVSTGGEIESLANSFTITGATPALISVAPSSAQQGQQNLDVIITGNAYTNFNACPGGYLWANFTGEITTNTVTALGANQVDANITVSQFANAGSITASLTCGTSGSATIFPFTFTVTASSASIVSVTPNSVAQGGQVTLTVVGSNTNWKPKHDNCRFLPLSVSISTHRDQ